MDWPRPQPESSYLWDQVPQLRCYLYDPTSSHISTSLSRSLASRSLSSLVSRSPHLSLSRSLPSRRRSLPVALLLLSFVLTLFLLSALLLRFISTRFPVTFPPHCCCARYILPVALLATCQPLVLLFSKLFTRSPMLSLECQIVVRLYPRNRHRGFVPLRAFDRAPDSTAMMRENHKRLLLSRCTISVLMDTKTFQLRTMKRYRF